MSKKIEKDGQAGARTFPASDDTANSSLSVELAGAPPVRVNQDESASTDLASEESGSGRPVDEVADSDRINEALSNSNPPRPIRRRHAVGDLLVLEKLDEQRDET